MLQDGRQEANLIKRHFNLKSLDDGVEIIIMSFRSLSVFWDRLSCVGPPNSFSVISIVFSLLTSSCIASLFCSALTCSSWIKSSSSTWNKEICDLWSKVSKKSVRSYILVLTVTWEKMIQCCTIFSNLTIFASFI